MKEGQSGTKAFVFVHPFVHLASPDLHTDSRLIAIKSNFVKQPHQLLLRKSVANHRQDNFTESANYFS
ncbi:hypothetical protein CS912_00345 (plasmid) [Klebsiella variicola]|nr:hypothetical protein CTI55_25870 [Klebsiella pneumoniae]ATR07477.1 hypothetical protein CTI56_27250 [Klebsiella pneumoniae]ATR18586.1 hypothetical protein CTI58_27150 [Klebsiella pneumoniae]PHZ96799.1 hypothetical protein CS911_00530 [Klebsiella variicola]PIA12297.1 hypothetical protein CS912_00345 [Klebsiella variicola]